MNNITNTLKNLLILLLITGLIACSGNGSNNNATQSTSGHEVELGECTTSDDENSNADCGTLLLGLTDADGDFLSYQVNISGIELTRTDGLQVSIMPTTQTIDFTHYVEASELTTAATIPTGTYTSATITVDYTNANIQVEKNGGAVSADMVDTTGNPLLSQALQVQLDGNNRLIINHHRPAMLELDFNLAASHKVNLETNPVTVTTEPYIIAEVDPVMSKELRVRGPLIRTNEQESYFRIALRPFHRRDGRFGGANIQTNEETNFEINGEAFTGESGIAQMAALEQGTATVSFGIFNRAEDRFTAITVMAGSSVPGHDKDAARGVIIARQENTLTVKGAALIRQDGSVLFHDEISVVIAESTLVHKPRRIQDIVTIDDLSVGQAVTILGDISIDDADNTTIDASNGAIKMRLTFASGHALSKDTSLLTMDLQALQGRSPDLYDFSGTGIDPSFDASQDNYEVSLENLIVSNVEANDPVRVSGFISPFGSAPADFEALNVINYAESRSQLLVDWPNNDDATAFSDITTEGLTINIVNNGDDGIYKLIQGGIRTDLTSLNSDVVIQPKSDRGIYTLRSGNTIHAYSNFAEFITALQIKLDEEHTVDRLHAMGGFSNNSKIFSAVKLAIKLNTAN